MRWIIGDVHGMHKPLEALLAAIQKADVSPRFIFVGDYVNRGPDSKKVVDLLLTLANATFLRGNHDDIFDELLNNHSYAANASNGDRLVACHWFMQHGLESTMTSYGVPPAEVRFLRENPSESRLFSALSLVPQSHRAFFLNLEPVVEEDDLFVAHGKWDSDDLAEAPSIAEKLQADPPRRQRLLWGRFDLQEILRLKAWRRTGYFGHTPVDAYPELQLRGKMYCPIVGNKIVLLDTAAALKSAGRLTGFCHEMRSFIQVDRMGKVVPA
jgi:serine/threonine protein phosphatase 1